jgi:hypothetical protein
MITRQRTVFFNWEHQSLKTPPNAPEDDQVIINLRIGYCSANFPFYKRRVEVAIKFS